MSGNKSGERTLLWSVLMSSPGPLVVGLGLLKGRSSTQIADFVRRSSELLAIIISYATYRLTAKDGVYDELKKRVVEKWSNGFVGAMMCLGGLLMILLTLTSETTDKGNVLPGLSIAVLGVVANSVFWRKYTFLNKKEPNAVLRVQSRLYGAKTLVDSCVSIALLSVALFPQSMASVVLDFAGSVFVAAYLVWCGVRTIVESMK